MIKTKNAGVQRAKYVIQEMSLTEAMRDAFEAYRKRKLDRKSEDAYVYDQGKAAGEQIGIERGIEQGMELGIEQGIESGKRAEIFSSVQDGDYSIERGAQKMGISVEEFRKCIVIPGTFLLSRPSPIVTKSALWREMSYSYVLLSCPGSVVFALPFVILFFLV